MSLFWKLLGWLKGWRGDSQWEDIQQDITLDICDQVAIAAAQAARDTSFIIIVGRTLPGTRTEDADGTERGTLLTAMTKYSYEGIVSWEYTEASLERFLHSAKAHAKTEREAKAKESE